MDNNGGMSPRTPPHLVVKDAFKKFELLIRPGDDRMFKQTSLEDVRKAAYIISRDQSERNCLRNLNRIKPLFDLLNKLAGPIETLCQGTPYLCYIWAPIKLLLQIADEYSTGFDKLVDAYVQIAQHMPRLDRLNQAFSDQPDFQSILADLYSDILEFHSHAYRFLRRGGWKILFDASWRSFGTRFNGILRRLDQGRELLDKEAASFNILESKDFRHRILEDLDKRERERIDWQMRDALLWLDLKGQDREQKDLMDHRTASRQPNTCTWILSHPKVTSWLDDEQLHSFLWLNGKPGSGKTTLATFLIEETSFPPGAMTLYCLCSYGFGRSESNACSLTLRSLIAQILRSNPDMLPYVYDNYVKVGAVNAVSKTRTLLRDLLRASEMTYLVIDGMDECEHGHQKQILNELFNLTLQKGSDESIAVKILVCSRETPEIARRLGRVPKLSLNDVKAEVERDIATFARAKLLELHGLFDEDLIAEIGQEIVRKANGMFLWVQLVMSSLIDQGSVQDLRRSISRLPADLRGVYKSVLDRILRTSDDYQQRRIQFVLGLLALSYRPLKTWEVCDLIVFHEQADTMNDQNKLAKNVLNVCKPFIEELDDGNVHIVHFSAREFLLERASGPFVVPVNLHYQIAAACTRYLLTCDGFLEDSLGLTTIGDMARGYHDLFPYVYEFWTIHLEQVKATTMHSTDGVRVQELSELMQKLAIFVQLVGDQGSNAATGCVPQDPAMSDLRLPLIVPPIIGRYVTYRNRLVQNQRQSVTNHDGQTEDSTLDPTVLTSAHEKYLKAFESLLNGDYDVELVCSEIDDFKSRHGAGAFMCRWTGCVWASTGFRKLAEREKHEISHRKRFRCPEVDCDNALGGFSSKQALRSHKQKYHTTIADIDLPPFLNPHPVSRTPDHNRNYKGGRSEELTLGPLQDIGSREELTRSDNVVINQRAAELARCTSAGEMHNIVQRMDRRIRANLNQKGIDPIIYHFRMLATIEFWGGKLPVSFVDNANAHSSVHDENDRFSIRASSVGERALRTSGPLDVEATDSQGTCTSEPRLEHAEEQAQLTPGEISNNTGAFLPLPLSEAYRKDLQDIFLDQDSMLDEPQPHADSPYREPLSSNQTSGSGSKPPPSPTQLSANSNSSRLSNYILSTLHGDGLWTGWQAEVPLQERVVQIKQLVESLRLLGPPVELQRAVEVALNFERKEFAAQPTKEDYQRECADKLSKIRYQCQQQQQQQGLRFEAQETQLAQQQTLIVQQNTIVGPHPNAESHRGSTTELAHNNSSMAASNLSTRGLKIPMSIQTEPTGFSEAQLLQITQQLAAQEAARQRPDAQQMQEQLSVAHQNEKIDITSGDKTSLSLNPTNGSSGLSSSILQDWQIQLLMIEASSKRRLIEARRALQAPHTKTE